MPERDWTQPPSSETAQSLWVALHDGTILGLGSDRLARTIRVEVELGFPSPPEPCPDTVVLALIGVTHAYVFVKKQWPGPAPRWTTPVTPEMEAAGDEHRRKGRAETMGLAEFARRLADETPVEIMQATLEKDETGVTLVLDGYMDGDGNESWYQLRVGTETIDVLEPDGLPIGLGKLLDLGKAGWDAWNNRAKGGQAEPEGV